MSHFVLVYDQSAGQLLEFIEFQDSQRDEAMRVRFEHELKNRTDSNIEVVVLSSSSREALRETHSRYFNSPSELSKQMPKSPV